MITSGNATAGKNKSSVWLNLGLLALLMCLLFFRIFDPNYVVFSNDGPFGAMVAQQNRMPDILTGLWVDLNWIGGGSPAPSPAVSSALRLITTPLIFAKIYAPFSMFLAGFCAWIFFRQLKLTSLACLLGSVAVTLNSDFFSSACWGVCSHPITFGACYLALAALVSGSGKRYWIRTILGGMAVGLAITEGYDIGAIFSLFVAAFVVYQALICEESPARKIIGGVGRVAIVAIVAAFFATHTLSTLVGTQIKGVVGMEQDAESKARRWDEATQWSFPKGEIVRVLISGLYGYRMDTPGGGAYWGKAGETPGWSEHHTEPEWQKAHPRPMPRFSGGGEYAGVLVVVVIIWALLQAFRKKDSVFTLTQRRFIWFWAVAAFISTLLAFGRYAPFYQFFYALPYFSTIRNPAKFMHTLHFSLLIIFAYGLHGLSRRYLENPAAAMGNLKSWWTKAASFDKRWTVGCVIAVASSLLGWLLYASSRTNLENHLQNLEFDPASVAAIATFSFKEVGWFILFLILTVGLFTLILSGRFAGRRAKAAGILLGALLVIDLARANVPWVIFSNYKQKYASNPVIDFLREKPYEHRTIMLPFQAPPQFSLLGQVYGIEWSQHLFQYYNIQSLDRVQEPRVSSENAAYRQALGGSFEALLHQWQLTNTRYLLGAAGFLDVLNQQIDPGQHRFRIALTFDLVPKPGVVNPTSYEELTAVIKPNGQYAVFEFTGALPRVKLYSNWLMPANDPASGRDLASNLSTNEVETLRSMGTNDFLTLKKLASPSFDPQQTVLLADQMPSAPSPVTNQNAGTVEFASYAPKHITLRAKSEVASVLLLNDKHHPDWKVLVDGQPAALLRCNYIMRGVYLKPGAHTVEFHFRPPLMGLYVSLAALVVAIALGGFLIFSKDDKPVAPEPGKARSPGKELAKK